MIAAKKNQRARIGHFHSQEKEQTFARERTSIDIITQEDILLIADRSSELKDRQQVVKLSMNVAHDSTGARNLDDVRFSTKQSCGLREKMTPCLFSESTCSEESKCFIERNVVMAQPSFLR